MSPSRSPKSTSIRRTLSTVILSFVHYFSFHVLLFFLLLLALGCEKKGLKDELAKVKIMATFKNRLILKQLAFIQVFVFLQLVLATRESCFYCRQFQVPQMCVA